MATPTDFTKFFVVLRQSNNINKESININKESNNNIGNFHERVVYCQNHDVDNNTLKVINMSNGKNSIINISDIEYYLTFNNISQYKIGDNVSFSSGFDGENEIIENGFIVSIEYQYLNIYYSIQTSSNVIMKVSINHPKRMPTMHNNEKFKLGSYVSIRDTEQPNGFVDGKIVSINNLSMIYSIQVYDQIKNYKIEELNYPYGYNLIKIN